MNNNTRNGIKLGLIFVVVLAAVLLPSVESVLGQPLLDSAKRDILYVDRDEDNVADPGDTILYSVRMTTTTFNNAVGVVFSDAIDEHATLLVDSIRTSPIARHDIYTVTTNTTLLVDADIGVLANDDDPDGHGVFPDVIAKAYSGLSLNEGAVNLESDGSFTYTPAADFEGSDSFSYAIVDGEGVENYATVFISVGGNPPVGSPTSSSAGLIELDATGFLLDLGDLNGGEQLTITFLVVVRNSLPESAPGICNQGVTSGSNFADHLTTDPDTTTFLDPTCTPVHKHGGESRITYDQGHQGMPDIWGDWIVWGSEQNGDPDIYRYNLMNGLGSLVPIDPGAQTYVQTDAAISASHIVWTDFRHTNAEVYAYDLAGEDQVRVTSNTWTQWAVANWDDRVVWHDNRNGSLNWDIFLRDLEEDQEIQITTDGSNQRDPAIWGSTVIWVDERNANPDIYAYDLLTETEIPIIAGDSYTQTRPVIWQNRIVWEEKQNGHWDLYMCEIDLAQGTCPAMPVTTAAGNQMYADIWGDWIVWMDGRHGNSDIYLYDIGRKLEFPISTHLDSEQRFPKIWGEQIVWMDNRHGNWDIYLYRMRPVFSISPGAYDFGYVEVWTTNKTLLTVSNNGPASMTLADVFLTADCGGDLSISQQGQLDIEPGSFVDIEITFNPSNFEPCFGNLTFISNDPDTPSFEVGLSGLGVLFEEPPENQIIEILNFVEDSVAEGELEGNGQGASAEGRMGAFVNMVEAAGDMIDSNDLNDANQQLMDAYRRTDSLPNPPDFVGGPATAELASQINNVRLLLTIE